VPAFVLFPAKEVNSIRTGVLLSGLGGKKKMEKKGGGKGFEKEIMGRLLLGNPFNSSYF